MEDLIIDEKFILPYWNGKKLHKNYFKSKDVADHIQFHFEGYFKRPWIANTNNSIPSQLPNPYFTRLIDSMRPSESDVIRTYRRDNYLPYTKIPCHKVVNAISRITKSSDWQIDYSHSETPPILLDTQSLEAYAEKLLPKENSIEQWATTKGIRWMLIDPNAIWVVMPINWDIPANEMYKPYPHIIESKNVYDYKEGSFVVFLSPYVNVYVDETGKEKQGKIITVITPTQFVDFKETGKKTFDIVERDNIVGEIPCGYFGGEDKTPDIYQPFYESFIQGMLPALDEVAIDSSDLRGEKLQHIGSTYWYIQGSTCNPCNGTGVLPDGKQTACTTCNGRGGIPFSPYRHLEINPNNLDLAGKNVPFPPMGIVEKDKGMIELMREEIRLGINSAYAAVNMEHVSDDFHKPESGLAKGYNADDTNNFINRIAYHLIEEIIKPIYYYTNEIRYGLIVQDKAKRMLMLPTIPVPQSYDFLTNKDAEDNLIKVAGADVDQTIKEAAMFDFIMSKYQDQPEVRNKLIAIFMHDPLSGMSTADIQSNLNAGLVTKVDAILHFHIKMFVTDLISETDDFLKLSFDEQKEQLLKMANDKLTELEAQATDAINKMANKKLMDADGNQVDSNGSILYTAAQLKTMGEVAPQRKNGKRAIDRS